MNLKHSILLAMFMLTIIPIIILNSILIINNKKETQTLVEQKLEFESKSNTNTINNYMNNMNNIADILCLQIDVNVSNSNFSDIVSLYPEIKDIILTDNNSQYYSYNNYDNSNLISRILSEQTIQIKNELSQFFIYGNDNTDICFAIIKDIDDETVSNGKMIMIIDIDVIQTLIDHDYGFNYTQSLVDCMGNVSNYPFVNIINSDSNSYKKEIYNYVNKSVVLNKTEQKSFYKKDFDNQHIILVKCNNNDLYVCTRYNNKNVIFSHTGKIVSQFCLVIMFVGIIVLIAIFFVDYITKPIRSMIYYISNRKDGDKFAFRTTTGVKDFEILFDSFSDLITDLSDKEQKYRAVVEMSDNIIFEYKINKNKIIFSNNFNSKFSFRPKTSKYEDSFFEVGPVYSYDADKFKDILTTGFKDTNYIYGEYRFLDIYGQYVWYLLRATLLYDNHGNKLKIIGCFFDINNTKKSELALIERAEYDSLTNLLNRETFIQRLEKEVELSSFRKNYDAILFIDIDNFKSYNDNYNHAVGDEVLSFIGKIIKNEVKDIGFAGRYGGDEFIVCLNTQSPFEVAPKYAETILSKFDEGYYSDLTKTQFSIKCSIGISFFSRDCNDYKTVIKNADEAMYRVKRAGKSNYSIYL